MASGGILIRHFRGSCCVFACVWSHLSHLLPSPPVDTDARHPRASLVVIPTQPRTTHI